MLGANRRRLVAWALGGLVLFCLLGTAAAHGWSPLTAIDDRGQSVRSFAVDAGETFPRELYNVAQLVGGFSFDAARRISGTRDIWAKPGQTLTDRQLDCVLWAARGKTDYEISVILNISHETVIQHLKHARERYGVRKRAMLAVRALYDGLISFADILRY